MAWTRRDFGRTDCRAARRGSRIRLGQIVASSNYVAVPDIVQLQDRIATYWDPSRSPLAVGSESVQLQDRIATYWDGVTRFLDDPTVPWNDNASERDVRPVCRYRAITGGTRSSRGSVVFGHWMSVVHTGRKNGLPLPVFVRAVNDAHRYGTAPPSVFVT